MIANLSHIKTLSTEVLDAPFDFSEIKSERVLIGGVFCAPIILTLLKLDSNNKDRGNLVFATRD